jgi:hypothetical protein
MTLERKDIRAKLDANLHAALTAICDLDGLTQAEFIEAALIPVLQKRIHDAIALAKAAEWAGISGNGREHLPDQPLVRGR